ncbi:hypothetical protein GCM10011348_25850 [Marinobacterium nitratireducens]|uniref:DUF3549 domain-containing protein n=1 Tax=Marinobacterium nitratireducens TaxID=518897 RepID=A0A917ZGZ0_9GAMM|nr:DUF3549 family protein [Marinobacterium nitratireducens]GGO83043.1 hypothetical protein GCM10011348_25850 [Marinobacterium nitratireducens]
MTRIQSLLELIDQTGARCRLFDLGRRVAKLSSTTFARVEQGRIPYPQPYLHHAWVGLLLWHPDSPQRNAVWFLKLPLDEQGFLVQAVRDDLLHRLMQNIGGLVEDGNDALKDNPFSFKPDDEKMALFHAHAGLVLRQSASRYYEYAQHYFAGQLAPENWVNLGYQGIADLVVRLEQGRNEALLTDAIGWLPAEPLGALCRALEHVEPGHRLLQALEPRLDSALACDRDSDGGLLAALVRAVSNSPSQSLRKALLQRVLASPRALEAEVIVALATRCCESLKDPELLQPFLERLAAGEAGQAGFSRVLADLMFMPSLRGPIMAALRNPERSETLSRAIGEMFGQGMGEG